MTPPRAAKAPAGRIVAVELDPDSLGPSGTFIDSERLAAVDDLVADNTFLPAGRSGVFRLRLAVVDRRLVLDVTDVEGRPVARHILSLRPLQRVVKDYFLICESYFAAVRNGGAHQIEAVDMGRRGVHNEGAEILIERLKGKIEVDFATARRLFTLVCALRWRG